MEILKAIVHGATQTVTYNVTGGLETEGEQDFLTFACAGPCAGRKDLKLFTHTDKVDTDGENSLVFQGRLGTDDVIVKIPHSSRNILKEAIPHILVGYEVNKLDDTFAKVPRFHGIVELKKHPLSEHHNCAGLAMLTALHGRPLSYRLRNTTKMYDKWTLFLHAVYKVCNTLSRLGGEYTHGDLNMNNILVDDNDVYLIDFGMMSKSGNEMERLTESVEKDHYYGSANIKSLCKLVANKSVELAKLTLEPIVKDYPLRAERDLMQLQLPKLKTVDELVQEFAPR